MFFVHIIAVICGDRDLEFWKRDPKFDLNRANDDNKMKARKAGDFKDLADSAKALLEKHLMKLRTPSHRRLKLEPMQGFYKKPERHGRHHNNREKPRWPKPKIRPTKSHRHKHHSSKESEQFGDRVGFREETRSKQRKHNKKKKSTDPGELHNIFITTKEKHRYTYSSTKKVTPVYLREILTKGPDYFKEKIVNAIPSLRHKSRENKYALKTNKRKVKQKQALKQETKQDHEALSGVSPHLNPYSLSKHLSELYCKFPKANITQEVIGKSISYHDIILLKITEKKSDLDSYFRADDVNKFAEEGPEKKIVLFVHGLSTMGLFKLPCLTKAKDFVELLDYYLMHLDKFDIFVVPMANPDGVVQMQQDLLWNKNMSPQKACSGVALDRNFDVAWNETKEMSSCSQQYPGHYPFSEPESEAVRNVIHRYSSKLAAYFHVHGSTFTHQFFKGDAMLYPKGYSEIQSEDDKYIDLRGEIDEAMKLAGFRIISVAVDTLYNWYGKVTGTSVDYANTIYGIPYTMEMVMQPYDPEDMQEAALTQIWKTVINVTLTSVYRNTNK